MGIPQAGAAPVLSPAEAAVLARAFAPTLVFHPDESYFPVSPLFPLDSMSEVAPGDRAAAERLGTPALRLQLYDQLPRGDQLARAALAYRVFPAGAPHGRQIVLEYWCYYVFNRYRFHGSLIPWSAPDNHGNDLERVVFVVERVSDEPAALVDPRAVRRAFAIRRIVASAHDGSVNANQLDVTPSRPVRPPVRILVENGSHAMAPDVDGDGRITIGLDVNASAKFVWGIRDHGEVGVLYRPSFTDDRRLGVRLCGPDDAAPVPGDADGLTCVPYALQPAEPMQAWFNGPGLAPGSRSRAVGRTAWPARWFGDATIEDLVIPRDPAGDAVIDTLAHRRAIRETGLSIGSTLGDPSAALALGARWAWVTPSRLVPDVLVTGHALVNGRRPPGFDASVLGFYQLDVVTKAVFGLTWTDPGHAVGGRPWDVVIGVEFRAGRFRIRPNTTLRTGINGTEISLVF